MKIFHSFPLLGCILGVTLLSVGCGVSNNAPADIDGRVTIASSILSEGKEQFSAPTNEGIVYWIIDISVKNRSYNNPITAEPSHWKIKAGEKTYNAHGSVLNIKSSYPITVPAGESGQTVIRFAMPDLVSVSDSLLCYVGQEPNSYGPLSAGDKVAAYDWTLKKAIVKEQSVSSDSSGAVVLKLVDMWGIDFGLIGTEIFAQFESTPSTKSGNYKIALSAGKEQFGTQTLQWAEGQEVGKVSWTVDPTARPLVELARGKSVKEVFQVAISYSP